MNEQIQDIIARLEQRTEPQALSPEKVWDSELDSKIAALKLTKRATSIALKAGLHLWNDSLDASHSYAQQIEDDDTGSYWHAIMHRMEQDYSNSKYRCRLAGHHPVKLAVQAKAAEVLKQHTQLDSLPPGRIVNSLRQYRDQQGWSCEDFVDVIKLQESGQGTEQTRQLLEQLQQIELRQLFDYTYNAMQNNEG
jgi:hypothetical protein